MRHIYTTALFILLLSVNPAYAQVKIGNNPNSVNANSLLELETTNRGFLPPRVALLRTDTVASLSGTVPAGMQVYSSGGAIADGNYTWNGSRWLLAATSTNVRTNYVLVKAASDLPAAVNGVRTLAASSVYEINGTVVVTDKIVLNGSVVRGADATSDVLVNPSPSGELFSGTSGGSVKNLTLVASGSGGKVFNINAGGAAMNMIVQNCFIANSSSVGLIKGFGTTVFLHTIAYQNNLSGLTLENDTNVILVNQLWDHNNSNTYVKFVGSFGLIQLLGGDMKTSSAYSAKGLDISGITSISTGASLMSLQFGGNGTYTVGSFSNKWEVEATGLNSERDAEASGNIYLSAPAATTFAEMDVPVKVSGTTTPATLYRVSSPASNRITYTGSKTRRFAAICSLTGTPSSSNINYSFYIAKNGVILPESKQAVKMANSSDQESVTISCTVSMAPNDYVELWVGNNSNTVGLTIQSMNLSIR